MGIGDLSVWCIVFFGGGGMRTARVGEVDLYTDGIDPVAFRNVFEAWEDAASAPGLGSTAVQGCCLAYADADADAEIDKLKRLLGNHLCGIRNIKYGI